jgi:hypothetical protein
MVSQYHTLASRHTQLENATKIYPKPAIVFAI